MSEIALRKTIEDICRHRNRALDLYEEAFVSIGEADRALALAKSAVKDASPSLPNSYNWHHKDAKNFFFNGIELPNRERFMAAAKHCIDVDVWAHVIELSGLEQLMDKKAKDQLRQELMTSPPEATEDNIRATVEQFFLDSNTIFKRGIAECFSNLDRRFRSHDGWKIGSRIILTCAFNDDGHWCYGRNEKDTIRDIERVFSKLQGIKLNDFVSAIVDIDLARKGGFNPHQTEVDSFYFKVRIFKNGNAHLWFKNDDLVRQVNKILGEYYGAPIPEQRTYKNTERDDLYNPKTTLAKNYGFYPTPEKVSDDVIDWTNLWARQESPKLHVLEPSAGTGNLAYKAVERGCVVDCVEIQPLFAENLSKSGKFRKVIQCDFIKLKPSPIYDRVIMNPPFDRERDIDHVLHALEFLKPGGVLIAIMSAGTEFRETKKSEAFRNMMQGMRAEWRDLPRNSFSSVGTNCNTIMIKVKK